MPDEASNASNGRADDNEGLVFNSRCRMAQGQRHLLVHSVCSPSWSWHVG